MQLNKSGRLILPNDEGAIIDASEKDHFKRLNEYFVRYKIFTAEK